MRTCVKKKTKINPEVEDKDFRLGTYILIHHRFSMRLHNSLKMILVSLSNVYEIMNVKFYCQFRLFLHCLRIITSICCTGFVLFQSNH